jgi:cyclase
MSLSRREFITHSLFAAAAAGAGGRLPRLARNPFTEVRRNVGIFTARGGTVGWLVNPGGSVLVDSQFPDTAANCLAELERRGALPLEALINTHHHGDHTGGNGVIRPSANRIVAHERAVELQRAVAAAADPPAQPTLADTCFPDRWSARVGDETVRARHYQPAHTGGDAVVTFEQAGVVHMGDLVFHGAFPFVDRAGGASMRGWIEVLETVVREHPPETIYLFGHAAPGLAVTGSRADVLVQRDVLGAALEIAGQWIASGRGRDDLVASGSLPGFPDHVALANWLTAGSLLGAAFDELSGAG